MKNTVKIALMAMGIGATLFSSNQSFAGATDDATLNVVLSDVRTITVAPASATVTLNFQTSADYQNGVSSGVLADHLTVASTQAFKVTVKAGGDLTNSATSQTIPAADIAITATAGSGSPVGTPGAVSALSTSEQTLITSATSGTLQDKYDVEYTASGGNDFIGLTAGTFTATVTYTVEAP